MKRLFTYIATLLLLAACSSEEAVIGDNGGQEKMKGITAEIKDPVLLGDEFISRASLVYDDDNRIMNFKWDAGDNIGVFTYNVPHTQQQLFSQRDDIENKDDHIRIFKTQDGDLSVTPGQKYVSHFPVISANDYTLIPVDYTGQCQTKPVDFSNYFNNKNDKAYKASQPEASAHLSQYDFMCTGPIEPTPWGGIHFPLNRVGAIVRFWLVINSTYNYVYDELQLVNNTKMFTTKATMDASKVPSDDVNPLTPTEQSHTINLKFGQDGAGFDLSTPTHDGTKSTNPFYDWYNDKFTGYIQAYMMVAPIDLTGVESCVLYLVAHKKDTKTKHYFKSTGLSKPNLKPNTFYQWTVTPGVDTPIEVSEITVEEWREGTTFDNGNGNGTGSW